YMVTVVGAPDPTPGTHELFATEGGAAAMAYVFNTLHQNHIVGPGDAIAMATPIFTPYLQIPVLEDFGFRVVEIPAAHDAAHRFEEHALDRLRDPSIKAFFVINPGNPDSRAITPERLRELADLVVADRPDLVIVADTAYAAFVDGFQGTIGHLPRNVVCIHSFSKTFGATGNRLGFVAVHHDNVLDDLLRSQSDERRAAARERYGSVTAEPDDLSFMARLVADSRDVALHNIAGLATPAQVEMGLFSLFHLLPSGQDYIRGVRAELAEREQTLIEPLGVAAPGGQDSLYYALVDLRAVVRALHGDAADAVIDRFDPTEIARRLAADHGVIVLPGQLFDAESWDVRVSLASLTLDELRQVGLAMRAVVDQVAAEL
ncbi:MAG TPA: bifunctional aspartate transaminase/aspartate 4-decarboxylase, partial [Acidimicrobiales bacterium]